MTWSDLHFQNFFGYRTENEFGEGGVVRKQADQMERDGVGLDRVKRMKVKRTRWTWDMLWR